MKTFVLFSFLASSFILNSTISFADKSEVWAACDQITSGCNDEGCPRETHAGIILKNSDGSYSAVNLDQVRIDDLLRKDSSGNSLNYIDFYLNGHVYFSFVSFHSAGVSEKILDAWYQDPNHLPGPPNLNAIGNWRFSTCRATSEQ